MSGRQGFINTRFTDEEKTIIIETAKEMGVNNSDVIRLIIPIIKDGGLDNTSLSSDKLRLQQLKNRLNYLENEITSMTQEKEATKKEIETLSSIVLHKEEAETYKEEAIQNIINNVLLWYLDEVGGFGVDEIETFVLNVNYLNKIRKVLETDEPIHYTLDINLAPKIIGEKLLRHIGMPIELNEDRKIVLGYDEFSKIHMVITELSRLANK